MKKQSGLLRRLTALALALCMLAALTTEIFAVKNATYRHLRKQSQQINKYRLEHILH